MLPLLILLAFCIVLQAFAQYQAGTPAYSRQINASTNALNASLAEDLFGKQSSIPYTFLFREANQYADGDFAVTMIVDPCRANDPSCCESAYGTPEYAYIDKDGRRASSYAWGKLVAKENSRLVDNDIMFEPRCILRSDLPPIVGVDSPRYPTSTDSDADAVVGTCVGPQMLQVENAKSPQCSDFNSSVYASRTCTDALGVVRDNCVQIAYSHTAAIPACSSAAGVDKAMCGVFIELHLPQGANVVNEVSIPGGFVSGFKSAVIPTVFKERTSRVVCVGPYELWWVLRTPKMRVVHSIKRFQVLAPKCDWDPVGARYYPYNDVSLTDDV